MPCCSQTCTIAVYSGRPCHWSVLLIKMVTSLASCSTFIAGLLFSREDQRHRGDSEHDAQKTCQHAADDVRQCVPPAPVANQREGLPFERREGGVAAAEAGTDEQKPVLVLRRQALRDYHSRHRQHERPADVDEERPVRKRLPPRLRIEPPRNQVAQACPQRPTDHE